MDVRHSTLPRRGACHILRTLVDCTDKAKRTPLIRVAFNGEEECVRLLLENVYLFDPQGAEQQILQDKTIGTTSLP